MKSAAGVGAENPTARARQGTRIYWGGAIFAVLFVLHTRSLALSLSCMR